jgi:hypothetical protein
MNILRWLLLLTTLLPALSSCLNCQDQTCDCFSEGEDDVALYFDRDSLAQGFRQAELAGAYLVRYTPPGFTAPLDTIRPQPTGESDYTFSPFGVRLGNWLAAPSPSFAAHNYAVVLPRPGRRYLISDLEIAGETRGDRCCQCYRNTRKRLRLDGTYLVADDQGQYSLVLRR